MSKRCIIDPNPDVTGIGIRISVYALCLGSGILKPYIGHTAAVEHYVKFERALKSALQLQGLALLCTAINQTLRQQLTLFHGLCVLHLLAMLGFAVGVDYMPASMRRRHRDSAHNPRRILCRALRLVAIAAFTALSFVIWGSARDFGSQHACNAQVSYYFFGVPISPATMAAGSGGGERYIYPAFGTLLAVVLLTGEWHAYGLLGLVANGMGASLPGDIWTLQYVRSRIDAAHRAHNSAERRAALNREGIFWPLICSDRAYRIGEACSNSAVNVYMVAMMELTHSHNRVSSEEQEWTFGQVLSMFLLLGVAWEVLEVRLASLDNLGDDVRLGEIGYDEPDRTRTFDVGMTYNVPMSFYPSNDEELVAR